MSISRANAKSCKKVDFSRNSLFKTKIDPVPLSPWTTTEKSRRATSAPLLWPQELRASIASPSGGRSISEEEAEDPFAPEFVELDNLKRSCRQINKFYIPISKLPPLGGTDPRLALTKGPPSCAPGRAVPRAHLLMQRWQSMPHSISQLPAESLNAIRAAAKRTDTSLVSSLRREDYDRLTAKTAQFAPGSNQNSARSDRDRQPRGFRQNTDTRLARAFEEAEEGSARGKKEYPHIPCACCEHKKVKHWMQPKSCNHGDGSHSHSPSPLPSAGR